MVDQTKPETTLEPTPEQGRKFLNHIVQKYGPGADASAYKQNRFLYEVSRVQEEAVADAPVRSR